MQKQSKTLADGSKIVVTYGMEYLKGNPLPYFSITGEIRDKHNIMECCGCLRDEIALHFPHLVPLITWHLCNQDGTPMHYIANGLYWAAGAIDLKERWGPGDTAEQYLEHFKRTVRLSKEEEQDCVRHLRRWRCGHHNGAPESARADFQEWLEQQLQSVQHRFHTTMSQFGVQYIKKEVYTNAN